MWVELHLVGMQDVAHFSQVGEMILRIQTFYQHVVHVNLHYSTYLCSTHFFPELLIGWPYILELEWYHLVTIESMVSGESNLLLIWLVHADLVVSTVGIHKAQKLMSGSGVYQLVYVRQGKAILRTGLV